MFPPLPAWEGAHPIIVHFPIALALLGPIPTLAALLDRRHRWSWLTGAWLMLAAAAVFAIIAVMSGDAAEDAAPETALIEAAIHEHEELAELARTALIVLASLAGLGLVAARVAGAKLRNFALPAIGLLVLAQFTAGVMIANAAHEGGKLVHELGVRAPMGRNVSVYPGGHDDDD